jgi:hypothetical protein
MRNLHLRVNEGDSLGMAYAATLYFSELGCKATAIGLVYLADVPPVD